MSNVKIALIGAGYIADFHARGLQSLPNVEIVAVVAKELQEAKDFATKYNIKETYTDISPVINNKIIDAVIIGTPNQFHAPYAIEFLKSGKDVFLEKPMGISAEEGRQINEAAKKIQSIGNGWAYVAI